MIDLEGIDIMTHR